GHDVLLIERRQFPRLHVGESLNAGIWPLLNVLGIDAAVGAAGFRTLRYALVQWQTQIPIRREFTHPGLIVDRDRFDNLLLETARSCGVRVLQPAAILARRRDPQDWHLSVTAAGRKLDIEASILADASGRSAALRGPRKAISPRTIALYGYWRIPEATAEPMIAAGEECWFWGVPLPDGRYNAMAFIDPAVLRARKNTSATEVYGELIGSSGLAGLGEHAKLMSAVRVADATAYMSADVVGRDYIKLGEAALAIDPLSSSGVE